MTQPTWAEVQVPGAAAMTLETRALKALMRWTEARQRNLNAIRRRTLKRLREIGAAGKPIPRRGVRRTDEGWEEAQ